MPVGERGHVGPQGGSVLEALRGSMHVHGEVVPGRHHRAVFALARVPSAADGCGRGGTALAWGSPSRPRTGPGQERCRAHRSTRASRNPCCATRPAVRVHGIPRRRVSWDRRSVQGVRVGLGCPLHAFAPAMILDFRTRGGSGRCKSGLQARCLSLPWRSRFWIVDAARLSACYCHLASHSHCEPWCRVLSNEPRLHVWQRTLQALR